MRGSKNGGAEEGEGLGTRLRSYTSERMGTLPGNHPSRLAAKLYIKCNSGRLCAIIVAPSEPVEHVI